MANNIRELTGQRIGRLVVLEPTEKRINGGVVWKCVCDCGNYKEVPSKNLQTKYTQSCGCLKNPYSVNENYFKTWSPEMAYVLGFIFADGCIYQGSHYLCITLKKDDEDTLNSIKEMLEYTGPLHYHPQTWVYKGKKKIIIAPTLKICNSTLGNDLVNLGCVPKKSLVLKFPDVPEEYLNHFLRGYSDGDGCIYVRKNSRSNSIWNILGTLNFCEVSQKFINTALNISSGNIYKSGKIHRLTYSGRKALSVLDWLYQDSTIHMQRKYEKYLEYKSLWENYS